MVIRVRDPFATLAGLTAGDGQRHGERLVRQPHVRARARFRWSTCSTTATTSSLVAELPGVKKEDLDIQVRGDTVRIQGKKTIAYDESASVHRRERAAGQFDRTLTLPAEVDAAKVAAEYRDGVLTLRLPRAESAKPRTVTIN